MNVILIIITIGVAIYAFRRWGWKTWKSWFAIGVMAQIYSFFTAYPYSSADEVFDNIQGKTWVYADKDMDYWYKFVFNSSDKVDVYVAKPSAGTWGEKYATLPYKVYEDRYNDSGSRYYKIDIASEMWIMFFPGEDSAGYKVNPFLGKDDFYCSTDHGKTAHLSGAGDKNPWK